MQFWAKQNCHFTHNIISPSTVLLCTYSNYLLTLPPGAVNENHSVKQITVIIQWLWCVTFVVFTQGLEADSILQHKCQMWSYSHISSCNFSFADIVKYVCYILLGFHMICWLRIASYTIFYYSTITSFHQIRSRECTNITPKFTVVSQFDRFTTERIQTKTFHWLSVLFTSFTRNSSYGQIHNAGCISTLFLEKEKLK